ncbi:hypothetical protein ACFU5Y_37460 [Streptomyces gardneri]|uniref:hypothetical protein n=1 Tax=Streptomyces gardneri TaxID=66892 RepID=UPI0036854D95
MFRAAAPLVRGGGRSSRSPRAEEGLDVTFTVRDTGRRDGVEVAQVYVGPSPDLTALGFEVGPS